MRPLLSNLPAPATATALALALLAACLAPGAALADSLRCQGGLVAVGDTKLDLLGKCGRPALTERRSVERGGAVLPRGGPGVASLVATVTVETWTYDFGPRRFVQYVTLEGGRVTGVERGGYGYDQGSGDAGPASIPRARCDHLSIHEGDRSFDLLARCGEPASRDVAVVRQQVVVQAPAGPHQPGRRDEGQRERRHDRDRQGPILVQALGETVNVEVWAYDFGPQVLVRLVELEDGVVTRVDTGSHGYAR